MSNNIIQWRSLATWVKIEHESMQGPAYCLATSISFLCISCIQPPSVSFSAFEMMAVASSSSLTLSFTSNGRRVKTFASPSHLGFARFPQFRLPPRIFAFPPPQSRGFVSFSCLNDQFEEIVVDKGPGLQVQCSTWNWRDYKIRYQYAGNSGSALVLIHGFGANSDHWKKNIYILARCHKVYSLDLIGYGYSDKPDPDIVGKNFYSFETWAAQINDFVADVVKDDAFFVCNSIGGVVGLQAAVMEPQTCKGIVLLNISLRMLHIKKQPWYGRPLIRSFQNLLRNTAMGEYFFRLVATPESVKRILCQCYHDSSRVTDELVQMILRPGLEPGAAGVFLEFICYSGGPLPEELLPLVKCPVLIAWGDKDPWEPIELGASFRNFDSVEDFVVLPNVGHCPQDEAPHLVNPLVESFVSRHTAPTPI